MTEFFTLLGNDVGCFSAFLTAAVLFLVALGIVCQTLVSVIRAWRGDDTDLD